MEEEGGSAATELPMCNCGKPSAVQMSTTEEKKNLVGDFEVVRDEIYMKIKVQVSRPDSRSDPIAGSEPNSGCENIYWDSLPA